MLEFFIFIWNIVAHIVGFAVVVTFAFFPLFLFVDLFDFKIAQARKRLRKVRLMREIQILDDQDQFVDFDSSFTARELLTPQPKNI